MKAFLSLAFLLSFSVQAKEVMINDYDYVVSDISDLRTTKETIFSKMDRTFMKLDDSICSNRAAMWAWDFKLDQVPSAKIFLFFTPKSGRFDGFSWWYHTSPVVNEKGTLYVMDAGNPKRVHSALGVSDWMKAFVGPKTCKEITHKDTELLKLIQRGTHFPETTSYGKNDCYYIVTPPGYWTPSQVAMNALGTRADGTPVRMDRTEASKADTYTACLEATSGMFGYAMRINAQRCRNFLANGSQFDL